MNELHEWLVKKLEEREQAEKAALWRRKIGFTKMLTITTKFQYDGYNCEITEQFADVTAYTTFIKDMNEKGFVKPVYASGNKQEVKPDQNGKVASVKLSDKKTGQGKPMYDINIALEDGSMATVLKLNATEFRAGDEVWYFKNAKGYADVQLDFLAKEE